MGEFLDSILSMDSDFSECGIDTSSVDGDLCCIDDKFCEQELRF